MNWNNYMQRKKITSRKWLNYSEVSNLRHYLQKIGYSKTRINDFLSLPRTKLTKLISSAKRLHSLNQEQKESDNILSRNKRQIESVEAQIKSYEENGELTKSQRNIESYKTALRELRQTTSSSSVHNIDINKCRHLPRREAYRKVFNKYSGTMFVESDDAIFINVFSIRALSNHSIKTLCEGLITMKYGKLANPKKTITLSQMKRDADLYFKHCLNNIKLSHLAEIHESERGIDESLISQRITRFKDLINIHVFDYTNGKEDNAATYFKQLRKMKPDEYKIKFKQSKPSNFWGEVVNLLIRNSEKSHHSLKSK